MRLGTAGKERKGKIDRICSENRRRYVIVQYLVCKGAMWTVERLTK
jgi:hypothetical protein